jgi:hypothetical protein
VLILLTGALCIGLTDYIEAGFDLQKLLSDRTFFTNIALTNIGILCIILAILLYRSDKYKDNMEKQKQPTADSYTAAYLFFYKLSCI